MRSGFVFASDWGKVPAFGVVVRIEQASTDLPVAATSSSMVSWREFGGLYVHRTVRFRSHQSGQARGSRLANGGRLFPHPLSGQGYFLCAAQAVVENGHCPLPEAQFRRGKGNDDFAAG